MQCLTCKTTSLEPKEIEPGLLVAACPQCGGALVSLMNYRFWLDQHQGVAEAELLPELDVPGEQPGERDCPKCRQVMKKFQMGLNSSHKIDLCESCDEAWLDKGEWQLLKQLDLHGKLPRIFTQAWQNNIREARREALQEDRYEKMLGVEDFMHVSSFRQWLYRHPRKEEIKQYLMIAPE
ncbi:MAG: zf-TFIIB domain-containing protein [Cellvibrio sp.]|jgi:Zn-finger nucleic acid-binding protein